jgi:hypothetical protein
MLFLQTTQLLFLLPVEDRPSPPIMCSTCLHTVTTVRQFFCTAESRWKRARAIFSPRCLHPPEGRTKNSLIHGPVCLAGRPNKDLSLVHPVCHDRKSNKGFSYLQPVCLAGIRQKVEQRTVLSTDLSALQVGPIKTTL